MVEEKKLDFEELPDSIALSYDKETDRIKDFISGQMVDATPEEVEAVQVFARRLVEDFGYKKSQIRTRPQFRVRKTPSDEKKSYPVDIAVFKSDKHIETELLMIIECKQPKKNEGIRQLKLYMDMSPAVVGVWFNGKEHAYLRKIQKVGGIIDYVEIPNIPKKGQRIEDIGKFKRKDLHPTKNLKAVFRDIRNYLSQKVTGITRDEPLAREIINLLFCKIYDEKNTAPDEIVTFRSGVEEDPKEIAERIKELFRMVKEVYSDVFDITEKIKLDNESINYVVGEIQNYCLIEAERDIVGESFEVFIGPALKGSQGQFFTPRNIVKMAIKISDPSLEDTIIDPACGSGGFLIVALEHVWGKIIEDAKKRGFNENWIKNRQKEVATKIIRGIDKDDFLAKVTKAYMAIVGDGRGGIFCENSLVDSKEWENKAQEKISLGSFDILFTNPPFGSKIPVKDKEILEKYSLGHIWKKKEKGRFWEETQSIHLQQPPQILFIERCIDFLKDKGKMAIILPDGVLGGSKLGYIAHFIKKKTKILGLIDCPRETFQPFVPTKIHLVILQKIEDEKELSKNNDIFMAIIDKVGHDRKGRPIFKLDKKGEKIPDDDTHEVIKKYHQLKREPKKQNFSVNGYLTNSKWLENNLVARRYLPKYIEVLEKIRNSNYVVKTLGEISSEIRTGANIPAENYKKEGKYSYIMTTCVTPLGFNFSELKYVSKESYEENKTKSVKEGDILINRAGNAGISSIVPKDLEGALVCGFMFRVRLKKGYDPYYVIAFLNSSWGQNQMERISFGSMLDHITKDDLENILIVFPKEDKQKVISKKMKKAVEQQIDARKDIFEIQKTFGSNKLEL